MLCEDQKCPCQLFVYIADQPLCLYLLLCGTSQTFALAALYALPRQSPLGKIYENVKQGLHVTATRLCPPSMCIDTHVPPCADDTMGSRVLDVRSCLWVSIKRCGSKVYEIKPGYDRVVPAIAENILWFEILVSVAVVM